MLVLTFVFVFLGTAFCTNNSYILHSSGNYPSAIKHEGGYYVSTFLQNYSHALYFSTDLNLWTGPDYIFNENNSPLWGLPVSSGSLFASKKGDIRFYFRGYDSSASFFGVGAAFAGTPEGPYYAFDRPILAASDVNFETPFVFDDDGTYILFYRSQQTLALEARLLNSDGLSLMNDRVYTVMTNKGLTLAPKVFKRNNYYYVYYSVSNCQVGVARATKALGPFIPSPQPYESIAYPPTVLEGLDGNSTIAICKQCPDSENIFAANLGFDAAGWPYIIF